MSIEIYQTMMVVGAIMTIAILASWIRNKIIRNFARVSLNLAKFIDTRLTFIGVIHHELSHALLAFISGAKIVKVTLFKIDNKNRSLGEVVYRTRGHWIIRKIQSGLAGIAPVICASITLVLIYNYILLENSYGGLIFWVGVVLMSQIGYHMTLSRADLKASKTGIPILILIVYIISNIIIIPVSDIINFYIITVGILLVNLAISWVFKFTMK